MQRQIFFQYASYLFYGQTIRRPSLSKAGLRIHLLSAETENEFLQNKLLTNPDVFVFYSVAEGWLTTGSLTFICRKLSFSI